MGRKQCAHTPVYHLALAFPGDHVQQCLQEVVSDAAVSNDLVSEDDQAQVIHVLYVILLHIHAVLEIQTHTHTQKKSIFQ